MRKVVDKSYIRSNELKDYLKKDKNNIVVLTDYLMIESYRGDALLNVVSSMQIVCGFPEQVIVLKDSENIAKMHGKTKGLQKRLIDKNNTCNFPKFCQMLMNASSGDAVAQETIRRRGEEAKEAYEDVLRNFQASRNAMIDLAATYDSAEDQTKDVFINNVLVLTKMLFNKHPDIEKIVRSEYLHNMFIFRLSLCIHSLIFDWGYKRGLETANHSKLRNDMIDMFHVAYATYFDGLLTKDKKAKSIWEGVIKILGALDSSENW